MEYLTNCNYAFTGRYFVFDKQIYYIWTFVSSDVVVISTSAFSSVRYRSRDGIENDEHKSVNN